MENRYSIVVSDQSMVLELLGGKQNIYARRILLITASVILLMPVIVFLFLSLPSGEPPQFGFLFSLIFSWLCGGYLLRLYLWNTYGREVFVIQSGKLIYYADYKLFKDRNKVISFNKIDICYLNNDELFFINEVKSKDQEFLSETKSSLYFFKNNDEMIESHIKLSLFDIIEIYNQSKPILNSKRSVVE